MSDASRARAAAERFAPGRLPARVEPLGSGHIHSTLRASYPDGEGDLVLQQLNESVFPDLDAVMHNLAAVTRFLRERGAAPRTVLEVVPSPGGAPLWWDGEGGAWRAFRYLEATHVYDAVADDDIARTAAVAFGGFAAALSALDPKTLAVPIPHFHDLPARLGQLQEAVAQDPCGRLGDVCGEASAIKGLGAEVLRALEAGGFGRLPDRVVHNDCKVNNLLFDDASGEPLCVVDLDTVMAGSLLADFGELVRTAACPAPEDEPDLSRVVFSIRRFRALADGYLEGLGESLSDAERDLLWAGPPWMALENAARFLADHLVGDRYFRSGDNRARARAQLRLAERLWEAREELRDAVRDASGDG